MVEDERRFGMEEEASSGRKAFGEDMRRLRRQVELWRSIRKDRERLKDLGAVSKDWGCSPGIGGIFQIL